MKKFMLLGIFVWILGSPFGMDRSVEAAVEPTPKHIENLTGIFETKGASSSSVSSDGVVTITPSKGNQIGSIWSTDKNILDFSEDFYLSTYLNFEDGRDKSGDGLAFLLQAVTAEPVWFTNGAESLGYLGKQRDDKTVGIPNSLAIEFDLFGNKADFDGWFDRGISNDFYNQHIAYLWPGDANAYENWSAWLNTQRAVEHHQTIDQLLTVGKWVKLEINWQATEKKLTYTIDQTTTVEVPYEDLYTNVLSKNTKVYWGFTGATGTYATLQQVVFETVPGLINIDLDTKITNLETSQELKFGDSVYGGDSLGVRHTATYKNGKQNWEHIDMTISLPSDFVIDQDSLMLVTHSNDQKNEVIKLDPAFIHDGKLIIPADKLPALGEDPGLEYFIVAYTGKVKSDFTEDTLSWTGRYNGANGIFDLDEFSLHLEQLVPPTIELEDDKQVVLDTEKEFTLSGKWTNENLAESTLMYYLNDQQIGEEKVGEAILAGEWNKTIDVDALKYGENDFTAKLMTAKDTTAEIRAKVLKQGVPKITDFTATGGKQDYLIGETMDFSVDWQDPDSDTVTFFYQLDEGEPLEIGARSDSFTFQVPTADLPTGKHRITIYGEDEAGNRSETRAVEVNLAGTIQFTQTPADFFVTIEESGEKKSFKIDTIGKISIADTRDTNGNWRLHARLANEDGKNFTNENGKEAAGSFLTYRKPKGGEVTIDKHGADILTAETTGREEVEVDQSGEAGFYIKPASWMYKGHYHSTIQWEIIDAP